MAAWSTLKCSGFLITQNKENSSRLKSLRNKKQIVYKQKAINKPKSLKTILNNTINKSKSLNNCFSKKIINWKKIKFLKKHSKELFYFSYEKLIFSRHLTIMWSHFSLNMLVCDIK